MNIHGWVAENLTATDLSGTGQGTIAITGGGTLAFLSSQTLDQTHITLGDASPGDYAQNALYADGPFGQPATLTLGAQATVTALGYQSVIAGYGDGNKVANFGTIAAASQGGSLLLSQFANAGLVSVEANNTLGLRAVGNAGTIEDQGGTLTLMGALSNTGLVSISGLAGRYDGTQALIAGLDNRGTFSVSGGATASLGAYGQGWTNEGTLAVSDGLLSVGGSFTTAQLGAVRIGVGGTLGLAGTLANAGTLAIGPDGALTSLAAQTGGTIQGGTVLDPGGSLLARGGTLAGVTYRGVLSLAADGARLTATNLTLVSSGAGQTGSIALTGAGAELLFNGAASSTQVLDDATVALGGAGTGATLTAAYGQTLTLGTQVILNQAGAEAVLGSAGATLVNEGRIEASRPGGTLSLLGTLGNSGSIAVSAGTLLLDLGGLAGTGRISVTNGVVDIVHLTAPQLAAVQLSGSSQVDVTGTLTATGAMLQAGAGSTIPLLKIAGTIVGGTIHDGGGSVQFVGASTLDGVGYQGPLTIDRPFATVTVRDGLHLAGAAGAPGTLALIGAGSALVWDSTQALDNATLLLGSVSATYGAPALLAGTDAAPLVLLGSHLQVRQSGAYAQIGGLAGNFSSAATLTANVAGGQFTLGGDRYANTGTIGISHGDTVTLASGGFTNAGLIVVGVDSALDLNLVDYFASGSLADQSFTNAGRVQMAGGTLAELTAGGAFPKVPLLNAPGAVIAGAGVIASQIDNQGTIEARGGVLNLVQTVSGTGTLRVDAGATLVLGGVGAGQTVVFGGTGGVLGLQPAFFAGSLSGFTAGNTIDLFNTGATAASFQGDELVVTLRDGSMLDLATTAPLSGSLTVTGGSHHDTLIRFAPEHVIWSPHQ